jgi:sentrin-specific protease 1
LSKRGGSKKLGNVNQIYLPYNIDNYHWALIVIDVKEKSIRYLDSKWANGKGEDVCIAVLQWLKDAGLRQRPPFQVVDSEWMIYLEKLTPQQTNTCDCGIFTILFAYYVSWNKTLSFTQRDISKDFVRDKIAETLVMALRTSSTRIHII